MPSSSMIFFAQDIAKKGHEALPKQLDGEKSTNKEADDQLVHVATAARVEIGECLRDEGQIAQNHQQYRSHDRTRVI
jgi:hypothetical protein